MHKLGGIITALIAILASAPAQAQQDARRYKIEAAYIYNFFNYVTWPQFSSPQDLASPVICVNADEPILPYLQYIQKKVQDERTLTIRILPAGDMDAVRYDGCHIFYTSHVVDGQTAAELRMVRALYVASKADASQVDGMIELFQSGERIAMRINNSQLTGEGYQISSRLLSLAEQVK